MLMIAAGVLGVTTLVVVRLATVMAAALLPATVAVAGQEVQVRPMRVMLLSHQGTGLAAAAVRQPLPRAQAAAVAAVAAAAVAGQAAEPL